MDGHGRKRPAEVVKLPTDADQPTSTKKPRAAPETTYIEAPQVLQVPPSSQRTGPVPPSLFLGGGITGCPDWQAVVRDSLSGPCPDMVLINPRRAKWDPSINSLEQITWEFEHLRKAKAIMFWFPSETLCPITLYELGAWTILSSQTPTKLFVGCHEKYARKEDVIIQTKLANPSVAVREDLQTVINDIIEWYQGLEKTQPIASEEAAEN